MNTTRVYRVSIAKCPLLHWYLAIGSVILWNSAA